MGVSPPETSLSRISREVTLPQMTKTSQLEKLNLSTLPSLSSTIQTKSTRDTPQFWIATPPTLLASSTNFWLRSTEEPVRPLKKTHNSSRPEMPLSSNCCHLNQCVLKPSKISHHSV